MQQVRKLHKCAGMDVGSQWDDVGSQWDDVGSQWDDVGSQWDDVGKKGKSNSLAPEIHVLKARRIFHAPHIFRSIHFEQLAAYVSQSPTLARAV